MNRAVLLDRDGTINVDYGYLRDPSQLEFLPGVIEALRALSKERYLIIIITNQSGIGRGYFGWEEYRSFNDALLAALKGKGIEIAATYICPHAPSDNCSCRKPHPYMALRALEEFDIDPQRSYMFGDKLSDVECGEAAGVTSRLISGEQSLLFWVNEILESRL